MAARSKANTVFDRSNTGIVVSNLARGVDICVCMCLRFSVLCCLVQGVALRGADLPCKESSKMSKIISEINILNRNRS